MEMGMRKLSAMMKMLYILSSGCRVYVTVKTHEIEHWISVHLNSMYILPQ